MMLMTSTQILNELFLHSVVSLHLDNVFFRYIGTIRDQDLRYVKLHLVQQNISTFILLFDQLKSHMRHL